MVTELSQEEGIERWITTASGIRVKIKEGQDVEDAIRDRFSASGQKGQATRDTQKEHYFQRYTVYKSPFKPRDIVSFDKYESKGIVSGFEGDVIRILDKNGDIKNIHKTYVFKSNELLSYGHWDALNDKDRADLLDKANLSLDFIKTDWSYIPQAAKDILKATSPAGYDQSTGGFNTGVQGTVNPVSTDLTVSEKIRQEITRRASESLNTPPKILEGNEMHQTIPGQEESTGEKPKEQEFTEKPKEEKPASIQGGNEVKEENPVSVGNVNGEKEPPKEKKPKNE